MFRNQIRTTYNFYDASKKEFQPRIGFAYRLTDKWVIRSGFGIYFNVNQLNKFHDSQSQPAAFGILEPPTQSRMRLRSGGDTL